MKYQVTYTREITQTVSYTVEAPDEGDAELAAQRLLEDQMETGTEMWHTPYTGPESVRCASIDLVEDEPAITTEYRVGDLLNGDLETHPTYEAAYKAYKEMAEGCAQTERGNESVSREQAVAESMAFHYVCKATITTCGDDLPTEEVEFMDGNDAEACGYSQ